MIKMNVITVRKKGLCCGCGTCVGICPAGTMKMKINERGFYVPRLEGECTHCGLCDQVCPQIDEKTNLRKLKKPGEEFQEDEIIGPHINCYLGYSTNENLRFEASSGGVVTQILISAIDAGIINGALVTKISEENPLIPQPFIARTKEEIISAMGSKYCPVPANIALREILNTDGKFAVVGLPCHIKGIKKAETAMPNLKEKIILHFGLFCGGAKSFLATDFLLKSENLQKEDVLSLKYRGRGWPGYLQIKTKKNKRSENSYFTAAERNHILHYPYYYGGLFGMFFKPDACLSCQDYFNEMADISFGDPWGLEKEDKKGSSIVLTRTKFADELLNKFYSEEKVFIAKIDSIKAIRPSTIFRKKLPIKMSNIFWYNKSELGLILYSIPFLNHLSTHPNRIVREISLLFLNSLVKFLKDLLKFGRSVSKIIK